MSSAVHRYLSPLRYPGGKAKVADFVKLVILENDLLGARYVEPYAGGATVALGLLFEDYVSEIVINDLNEGVHAFWASVLYETDALCELVMKRPLTVKEWRAQREKAFSPTATTLERGFATFYLNRTNRSGIVGGGVIGGLDQTGRWKIDARFPRDELVRRIHKVGRFRSRISATRIDTLALLQAEVDASSTLYFLDPPYYVKGERLYDNFYEHDDHVQISQAVRKISSPWIVSYDAAPAILPMYDACESVRYCLAYSASRRHDGAEVMFFSPGLVVPNHEPSAVSTRALQDARMRVMGLAVD